MLCRTIDQSGPYWSTANKSDLVTQHGLQIGGILADGPPAVEERVLQERLSTLVANSQLRGERIASVENSPEKQTSTLHSCDIEKTYFIVLAANLW